MALSQSTSAPARSPRFAADRAWLASAGVGAGVAGRGARFASIALISWTRGGGDGGCSMKDGRGGASPAFNLRYRIAPGRFPGTSGANKSAEDSLGPAMNQPPSTSERANFSAARRALPGEKYISTLRQKITSIAFVLLASAG